MTTATSEQTLVNRGKKSEPRITIADDKPLNCPSTPIEVVAADDITTSNPTEETALIDDATQVKTTAMGPTASAITSGLSVVALVFLVIISIIPLLQVIFGLKYADECPVNWRIPHYLVVAGVVGLIAIGLNMIGYIYDLYRVIKSVETSSTTKLILNGVSIILLLIRIFICGWYIAGCIWLFRVWNEVQYENPNDDDYCHKTLYRFTFWILLISVIYQLFTYLRFFFYGYVLARIASNKDNKDGDIPVPTTEQ